MKDEFYFTVRGNAKAIRLYMYVPKNLARYVENMFYSSFPTSEIKRKSFEQQDLHKNANYMKFSDECVFYEAQDFSK